MSEATMTPAHDAHAAHAHRVNNMKLAWWLYLASEVVIFGVMIAAYVVFRVYVPEMVHEVHKEAGILLVSLNTFLLLTSSWCMVMGLNAIQKGDRDGLVRWIAGTAALGAVFLVLQGIEYSILSAAGVLLDVGAPYQQFAAHFYPPTFFHGLHVFVGVLWALHVIRRGQGGHYSPRNYLGVELFGLYWHFVDVVWIVLFTMIYLV